MSAPRLGRGATVSLHAAASETAPAQARARNHFTGLTKILLGVTSVADEIVEREKVIRVGPHLLGIPPGIACQRVELGNGILVRVFNVDTLPFLEGKFAAEKLKILVRQRHEIN